MLLVQLRLFQAQDLNALAETGILLHHAVKAAQQGGVRANIFCNAHRYFLNS